MRSNKLSTGLTVVSTIITAILLATGTYAPAQQETVLLSFNGIVGGSGPLDGLIFDAAGNLYGTTYQGGTNLGTVFELTPKASVGWTETILHTFGNSAGTDGYNPVSGLILDSAGNLYGTTPVGGSNNVGIVFKLTPAASNWTETVLHTFNANGTDGYNSYAGLVFDSAGNLYGTTNIGGTVSDGTVFEITP